MSTSAVIPAQAEIQKRAFRREAARALDLQPFGPKGTNGIPAIVAVTDGSF
jgi:hypothetical protein